MVFGSNDLVRVEGPIDMSGDTGKGRFWSRLLATRAFGVLSPVGVVPVSLPAGDLPSLSMVCPFIVLMFVLDCAETLFLRVVCNLFACVSFTASCFRPRNEGSFPDERCFRVRVSIFLSTKPHRGR